MGLINLFTFQGVTVSVDPQEHKVSDPARATKSAAPEALRNLGIAILITLVVSGILLGIGLFIEGRMAETTGRNIVLTLIYLPILGMLYLLGGKIMPVFTSLFKPNLKNPKSAIKSFLFSLEKGLHSRAYNLLTDTAQKQEKLNLPKENEMQKKMSTLEFNDLDTFTQFWDSIAFSWKHAEFAQVKQQDIDDDTSLVEVNIEIAGTSGWPFTAKFVMLKRHNLWFVGNGYFWPQLD